MGFATHLGPWLLGTVKNTTGTTSGTVRNLGATVVAQTYPLTYSTFASTTGTLGAIPAGSLITGVTYIVSTDFTGATTLKITIGGVDVATAASISTAAVTPVTLATTFASTAANVGSSDALVTYTSTGTPTTGAITVVVSYVVRNSNGAANPTGSQN
jgi:hypothetical protein